MERAYQREKFFEIIILDGDTLEIFSLFNYGLIDNSLHNSNGYKKLILKTGDFV